MASYFRNKRRAFCKLRITHRQLTGFVMSLLHRKYFCKIILSLEPVGLKSPAFSSESKSSTFVKKMDQGIALLCSAQGYPAPAYKYTKFF